LQSEGGLIVVSGGGCTDRRGGGTSLKIYNIEKSNQRPSRGIGGSAYTGQNSGRRNGKFAIGGQKVRRKLSSKKGETTGLGGRE